MKTTMLRQWLLTIAVGFLLAGQLFAQRPVEVWIEPERPELQIASLSTAKVASANLDEIVALIERSEDRAKATEMLMNRFKISADQAVTILNMPLQRLTGISQMEIDLKLDGMLNERVWMVAADSIADLITVEPVEGGEPESPTVVKVLASTDEIVIGAWCYDYDPRRIVSFSKERDSVLDEEDHLMIVLDTFMDGRSGYVFAVNPSGARFDGLVIEQGGDVNRNWDAIWQAKTSRDTSGWYAEIRIPIKSLSYSKDASSWGINIQRGVQRFQEISRWAGVSQDFEIYQTSRAGLLTNLPNFNLGQGFSIRPSFLARAARPNAGAKTNYDSDFSLDITKKLGSNLTSALTFNTDFAETEVDLRKINLSRFPVFFPEKRTFFLQGSDIFQFGLGLDEERLIPFFSRRIGLYGPTEDSQQEVPIKVGGKIDGRFGNTNMGALVVNTRTIDSLNVGDAEDPINIHLPEANMGAIRISQNIMEESSFGMLASFGDQMGRANSWMGGVDFTYRTSRLMVRNEPKNFIVNFWGLFNNREDLQGKTFDKSAFGVRVDYPNDFVDLNFSSIRIGKSFDPSLGFVPRKGVHMWDFGIDLRPRPAWQEVRLMRHELSMKAFMNTALTTWESYETVIKPFDWLLESGDQFEAGLLLQGDRPPEIFEVTDHLDLPVDSYEWTRYSVGARSATKRIVSATFLFEFGKYYNGTLRTINAALAFKPSSFLTLELTGERNFGAINALPDNYEPGEPFALVEQVFTEGLFGARVMFNFSPDLQLSSLTQYDTQNRELGSNNKLRWTFDSLGDIFIVYNYNMVRRVDKKRWEFVSSEAPFKIQYALRF